MSTDRRNRKFVPRAARVRKWQTDPLVPCNWNIHMFHPVRDRLMATKPDCWFCNGKADNVWPMDLSVQTVSGQVPEALICLCMRCANECVRMAPEEQVHRQLPVGALRLANRLGLFALMQPYQEHADRVAQASKRVRTRAC